MNIWNTQIHSDLKEWILAVCVLAATVMVVEATRTFLRRLRDDQNLRILRKLAPSVSNLFYIIGLRLFADVAPFEGKLETWINGAIYTFSILICAQLLRRAALLAIEWSAVKASTSQTLEQGFVPLMRNVITLFIILTSGIMILKHFNYDVMSLVTALGVGSLAVGLAAKETLSNMISGFILIIDRNLRPGDRVNLSGSVGDVKEIGLRSTQIKMSDGNTLIVPNAELVNTKILNLSLPTREITSSIVLRVPYSVPFPKVKDVALSITQKHVGISKKNLAWVHLTSLSEGHQLITVGFWVAEIIDALRITSDINEQLLQQFQKESIPLLPPSSRLP